MQNIPIIDYGRVSNYVEDRGFGFVSQSIHNQHGVDVFFHIKSIKKSDSDVAKQLENSMFIESDNNDQSSGALCFWYRAEKTGKGLQVNSVVKISDLSNNEIESISNKIENILEKGQKISNCLTRASEEILGIERINEIKNKNKDYEIKKAEIYLKQLKEESIIRKNGSEPKLLISEQLIQYEIENTDQKLRELKGTETQYLELIEHEYKQIIEEVESLGFTHSKELSHYIVKNKLGQKYKNISGVVKMEKDGNSWDYGGGFPPNIYSRICHDLDLSNEGSNAKVVGFESYSDLYDE
jgi:cold shock CspA family protein